MTLRSPVPRGRRAASLQAEPIQVGETTEHLQRVVRKVGQSVNGMRGQTLYELQCQRGSCNTRYCEEGIRVRSRRCPACDGGSAGLPVPERAPDLFSALEG